jgi:hypothetical protein
MSLHTYPVIVGSVLHRNWKAQMAVDLNTKPLEEWVQEAVKQQPLNTANADEMDLRLLSRKPSQCAMRYIRMKAYGNHFRVDDPTIDRLQTYDSGMASVFHVPIEDAREVSINYVGILKDIFKVEYGPLHTPVILIRCDWMKRIDNRGNVYVMKQDFWWLIFVTSFLEWLIHSFFPIMRPRFFFLMIRRNQGGRWLSQHRIEYFPTMLQILLLNTVKVTLKIVPKKFCEV